MRRFVTIVVVGLIAMGAGLVWMQWDRAPTVIADETSPVIGAAAPVRLSVRSPGPGLEAVRLTARRGEHTWPLYERLFVRSTWRGSGVNECVIDTVPNWAGLGVGDGELEVELWASTYGWHLWRAEQVLVWQRKIVLDTTPPRLELLTSQHNVRLGGVELAIWRQSADAVQSGVEVGEYFFPAVRGFFADAQLTMGLFAIPQDLDGTAQPRVVAWDHAGNRSQVAIPVVIQMRRFAERMLNLDDDFLARKVPEIEAANQLPATGTLVERYLRINRDLRRQNETTLRQLASKSQATPHWFGTFHRQSNTAPLSSFADRRTYVYRGEQIDRQVHLGFDLASIKASPVEAAQKGTVVFAGNLGIYGNTVVVDHGLGVFTLYGHLRAIDVKPGDLVERGHQLGLTGETGLAAGDHLHFSVMLWGVHVDPVEWWDGSWIRKHLLAKIEAFPRASVSEGQGSP
ncbi:MAG: M23 family metallopeptidase [Candidatus Binatia bacterium]|nr:M23 family metallopeptidase [Candidatus Binatia bacterium]